MFVDPSEVLAVWPKEITYGSNARTARVSFASPSPRSQRRSPYGFIRIHRSLLSNGLFVANIQASETGEHELRLKNGQEHAVTQTCKKNLKSLAQCWIRAGAID